MQLFNLKAAFCYFVFAILCLSNQSFAQNANDSISSNYKKAYFILGQDTLPYRIYITTTNWEEPLPLVIFLHGSGERGNNNNDQLSHGADWLYNAAITKYPMIAVFPQCPSNSFWSNVERIVDSTGKPHFTFTGDSVPTKAMKLLMAFTKYMYDRQYVDVRQMYVGGLSMGAMGTIELVSRMPKMFAAAFPICGGGVIQKPRKTKHTAWWFFHGAKDDIVPPQNSIELAEHLKKHSNKVRISIYPEANHNSWDSAFAEPELLPWLFSHKR
jgi:predicted esterase